MAHRSIARAPKVPAIKAKAEHPRPSSTRKTDQASSDVRLTARWAARDGDRTARAPRPRARARPGRFTQSAFQQGPDWRLKDRRTAPNTRAKSPAAWNVS